MATSLSPATFIPTTSSSASQWMLWHKALKDRYGKATANTLWLDAWAKRQSSGANTAALRSYLGDQGITVESGLFGYAADFWDETTGFFSMGSKVGLYGGLALVALVLVPVMILLINLARKPESIGQIAGQAAHFAL